MKYRAQRDPDIEKNPSDPVAKEKDMISGQSEVKTELEFATMFDKRNFKWTSVEFVQSCVKD